jgi:hypothetical protein
VTCRAGAAQVCPPTGPLRPDAAGPPLDHSSAGPEHENSKDLTQA